MPVSALDLPDSAELRGQSLRRTGSPTGRVSDGLLGISAVAGRGMRRVATRKACAVAGAAATFALRRREAACVERGTKRRAGYRMKRRGRDVFA
ncbi:hypothetical protein JCM14124_19540 [Humidesulfovibrio idahonensis]